MPRPLPTNPDLDQLRRQARELLRALLARESAALQRLHAVLPLADQPRLAQALHVVAREHGFPSWPRLKAHTEAMAAGRRALARERRQRILLRREAEAQRIAALAEPLATAAARHDVNAMLKALVLGARVGDAVRAHLVEQGLFTSVVDMLLLGAVSSQPRVRFLAAQAMDHWADQRCADLLRQLLHDPVPRVRWAALHSLQCAACKLAPLAVPDDLTETLITLALHDPSVKVRRVATYELGELCSDPRAANALVALASDADNVVARNAMRALARQQAA